MKAPTVDQAYKMIRALKARGAKGDAQRIEELKAIIEEAKTKQATLLLDQFFPAK